MVSGVYLGGAMASAKAPTPRTRSMLNIYLQRARLRAGLTQEDAARQISETMRQSEIAKWENGTLKHMKRDKMARFAAVYGVPIEHLIVAYGGQDPDTSEFRFPVRDGAGVNPLLIALAQREPSSSEIRFLLAVLEDFRAVMKRLMFEDTPDDALEAGATPSDDIGTLDQ
jgi:transcriptional regulator with XRE-family HTH domain